MCYKGLIKRIVPFFLTFVVGLFIASLFVPIMAPNFNFRRGERYREMQRLRTENQELKRTNCELRRQMEELRVNSSDWAPDTFTAPVFDSDAPPPPPPPRAPRHPVFER